MVDARVCNDEKAALAEEISLAENIIREAMSPADECRGYRAAMDKGESEEELARRMGVTVRHVQGRLRLADLAEPIFDALAEGKITLDVAKAYGSTADRDTQLAAWNVFKDSWQGDQRSEEHTSELQSLMRISYAVFCLKKKTNNTKTNTNKYNQDTTQ